MPSDPLHGWFALVGEHRHRGRRVAGTGTGDPFASQPMSEAERGGHAVVLETPGGIEPLVLEEQVPGLHPHLAGEGIVLLQKCSPFTDGHDVLGGDERQKLAKTPDAGEIQPSFGAQSAGGPAMLEEGQRSRHGQAVPVVFYIQQLVTSRAPKHHLVQIEGGPAVRVDAGLISFLVHPYRPGYEGPYQRRSMRPNPRSRSCCRRVARIRIFFSERVRLWIPFSRILSRMRSTSACCSAIFFCFLSQAF